MRNEQEANRGKVTLGEPSLIKMKCDVRGAVRRINIQYRCPIPNAEGTMVVPPVIVLSQSGSSAHDPTLFFPVGR